MSDEFPVTLEQEEDGSWYAAVDTPHLSASAVGPTDVLALMNLIRDLCEELELAERLSE